MSDTSRTILPTLIEDDSVAPSTPGSYGAELAKISRVRQVVAEMDLIDCQNAYSQKLRQWLRYTQEFDNGAWVKTNCTVTANALVAPDGTTTADILHFSAANGGVAQTGS